MEGDNDKNGENIENQMPVKISRHRRKNKPILERKRRARINESLVQLKQLMLESLQSDKVQYSKLEKADILEMTVEHISRLQRHQTTQLSQTTTSGHVYNSASNHRQGYAECSHEIARYLKEEMNDVDADVKIRLLQHVSNCAETMTSHTGRINSLRQLEGNDNADTIQLTQCFQKESQADDISNSNKHEYRHKVYGPVHLDIASNSDNIKPQCDVGSKTRLIQSRIPFQTVTDDMQRQTQTTSHTYVRNNTHLLSLSNKNSRTTNDPYNETYINNENVSNGQLPKLQQSFNLSKNINDFETNGINRNTQSTLLPNHFKGDDFRNLQTLSQVEPRELQLTQRRRLVNSNDTRVRQRLHFLENDHFQSSKEIVSFQTFDESAIEHLTNKNENETVPSNMGVFGLNTVWRPW